MNSRADPQRLLAGNVGNQNGEAGGGQGGGEAPQSRIVLALFGGARNRHQSGTRGPLGRVEIPLMGPTGHRIGDRLVLGRDAAADQPAEDHRRLDPGPGRPAANGQGGHQKDESQSSNGEQPPHPTLSP